MRLSKHINESNEMLNKKASEILSQSKKMDEKFIKGDTINPTIPRRRIYVELHINPSPMEIKNVSRGIIVKELDKYNLYVLKEYDEGDEVPRDKTSIIHLDISKYLSMMNKIIGDPDEVSGKNWIPVAITWDGTLTPSESISVEYNDKQIGQYLRGFKKQNPEYKYRMSFSYGDMQ